MPNILATGYSLLHCSHFWAGNHWHFIVRAPASHRCAAVANPFVSRPNGHAARTPAATPGHQRGLHGAPGYFQRLTELKHQMSFKYHHQISSNILPDLLPLFHRFTGITGSPFFVVLLSSISYFSLFLDSWHYRAAKMLTGFQSGPRLLTWYLGFPWISRYLKASKELFPPAPAPREQPPQHQHLDPPP